MNFDLGHSKIRDASGALVTLVFQNENLFAQDESGKTLANVPDLICLMCTDAGNYRPLTNADIAAGMQVEIIAAPAHPLWWAEDKKAYACWHAALERAGFKGEMEQL